jgi:hypothetical protein
MAVRHLGFRETVTVAAQCTIYIPPDGIPRPANRHPDELRVLGDSEATGNQISLMRHTV